jgi:hypothetical protein
MSIENQLTQLWVEELNQSQYNGELGLYMCERRAIDERAGTLGISRILTDCTFSPFLKRTMCLVIF